MFRKHIMRLHGIPTDIVSDRGSIFVSQFWRSFISGLGVKPNFSTAFHPQSDGQTERVNQVIEQYLRNYCDFDQANWVDLLDLAEFSYNNSFHASTQYTPFESLYGFHPLDPSALPVTQPSTIPASDEYLTRIRTIHARLLVNLKSASENHARFYNRKVLELEKDGNSRFKLGDMVLLNGRNIHSTRPSAKLDQRMLGPFKIIGTTPSPLAFKLDLPPNMAIHPVFHANLLEPFRVGHDNQPQDPPPAIQIEGEPEYIVDRIIDSRLTQGNCEYLVHWRDYPDSENSWEPWEGVSGTSAFKAFHRRHRDDPTHHFPYRRRATARRSPPILLKLSLKGLRA